MITKEVVATLKIQKDRPLDDVALADLAGQVFRTLQRNLEPITGDIAVTVTFGHEVPDDGSTGI